MQAVGDFIREFNYLPVYNEVSGAYQVITGIWQQQVASYEKSTFSHNHPRYFAVKLMKQEGLENLEEGLEKLTRSAIVIGILALAYHF